MQVTLEPELEQQVQHKIASGEYPSADALLNAALRRFLSLQHMILTIPCRSKRCAANS